MKYFGALVLSLCYTVVPGFVVASTIKVRVHACPQHRGTMPTVQSLTDSGVTQDASIARSGSVFTLNTEDVHSWVRVSSGPPCTTRVPLGAIPGKNRDVGAYPSTDIALIDGRNWLLGLIPPEIQTATLFTKSKNHGLIYFAAAQIQGGAYYFDFLSPLSYILRLDAGAGRFIDVPIDLTKVSAGSGKRYDVASEMIERTLGH